MADEKLTDQPELLTPDAQDFVHVVDISDLSSDPSGSSKKTRLANLSAPILSTADSDDVSEGATNLYNRVPTGGSVGQALIKNSGTDFDASFATIPDQVTSVNGDSGPAVVLDSDDIGEGAGNLYNRIPTGGLAGQVLTKNSGADFDTTFASIAGVANTGPSILLPVHPAFATSDASVSGAATLRGGIYKTFETLTFNRVYVEFTTYAATRTLRFLMYQDQDGNGTYERVCTIESFDAGVAGVAVMTPTENPVTLLPNRDIILLWGNDGTGNIGLACYNNGNMALMSSSTVFVTGHIPTTCDTTISSTTSPATVDPIIGGADGFVGTGGADSLPILRLGTI